MCNIVNATITVSKLLFQPQGVHLNSFSFFLLVVIMIVIIIIIDAWKPFFACFI